MVQMNTSQTDTRTATLQRREARRAAERAALAEALGTTDRDTVERLHAVGLRARSAAMVEWLPAVDVAWLDGLDEAERRALQLEFATLGEVNDEARALLEDWLTRRPPNERFEAGREALRSRLAMLDPVTSQDAMDRIVQACTAAAEASGGIFGVSAFSTDERQHMDYILSEVRTAH